MGQVTNEQVNLMLRLYEERREPRLREARDWFSANFHVKTADDLIRVCPPGSKENTYMRMVLGYWEMVASIVNRGLIDEEFFFESNGEQWVVWEQVKLVIGAWRAMFSSPNFLANLETQCNHLEAWREKRSPGSNEAIRKVLAQMQQATQAQKAPVDAGLGRSSAGLPHSRGPRLSSVRVDKQERRIRHGNESDGTSKSRVARGMAGRTQGIAKEGEGILAASRPVEQAAPRTALGES